MIPDFTDEGLLREGVHSATIEEFEERFVYFDRSDRRYRIYDNLSRLLQEAKNSGVVRRVIVGGSFVTVKPEPNDFDCILVIDAAFQNVELAPTEYNLVSPERVRRLFGGDVFPLVDGTPKLESFIRFFQSTRDGESMGVVEIQL
jgi:hypothetical protein